ncbi:MAG: TlpA disulfide reductase family protein [Pseudomonadota bacterium]
MMKLAHLILLTLCLVACDFQQPAEPEHLRRPDFNLPDLQGKIHANSEWDGKVVIVNFWATWCPPCLKEIPMFIKLQEKYAERGLQLVGIAIDNLHAVQSIVDQMGINYPILVGDQKAINISRSFGNNLGALPFTAIVDSQGYIVLQEIGEMRLENTEQAILPLFSVESL